MNNGKCGKGWESGAGGKCVRSKKKRTLGQAIGGLASKAFPYKDVDKSYKWNAKKGKKLAVAAGIVAVGGGALALANHHRNKSKSAGAESKSGTEKSRRQDARTKVGGKCGKGWTEGPGDKCVRSSSKSSLTYGQRGEGVGGTAKWLAKKTIFGSGDVEYNRRRSLGQGRRGAGLHGLGSGIKGHFQDTLLGGGAPLTPGGMVGGSIYRRSRNVGQGRGKAALKGLAAGMAINVPLAIAATKATEYAMQKQSAQQSRRGDASYGSDGKCGKGWKPGPGGKCIRAKGVGMAGKIGVGLAAAALGGAAYAGFGRSKERGREADAEWDQLVKSSQEQKERISEMGKQNTASPSQSEASNRVSNRDMERKTRKVSPSRSQKLRQVVMRRKGRAVRRTDGLMAGHGSWRNDAAGKPRCKKGKPCGAICIPKDSDCREADLYGHETAKYNQEFMAASLMGWVDKSGQPDTSKLKTMRPADRNMLLKAAQDYMSQNFKYDSADADLPSIKQEIESAHGFGVDEIYRIHTRTDGSLVGIGASGGDFFEFDITQRSVGVIERPDLTAAANERARGALAAEGIAYRGDSAFEYLRGREVRMDAPMANGQCGKGWKPGPGGKCVRGKGMGMAAKIGVGLAGAAALGGAAYAGRKQLSEAYLNVRSGAAGSQAKYEARKAMTMAKRAAGKDARRSAKQGVSAVQGAANQAGREVRRAGVMAKRAAGKTVRQAGNVLGRGISEGTAKKVDQAKYEARKVMVQAKRAAGKDARRSAKQGIAAAQGTVAKVDRTAFATAGRVAGKDARQRVTGNVRQAIARDVREINREVGRQRMAGRK